MLGPPFGPARTGLACCKGAVVGEIACDDARMVDGDPVLGSMDRRGRLVDDWEAEDCRRFPEVGSGLCPTLTSERLAAEAKVL